MKKLVDRFIGYVKQHTTSDPESSTFPSTAVQLTFARNLKNELISIGLSEVELDENGYVTATIPANIPGNYPVVGFVAHMDTSPDFSGENVNPLITDNYNGNAIILNPETGSTLHPVEFPELKNYKGQTIITTDGTTLLGADNKAGIAEIVTTAEILINSPNLKHGKIRICFTPDEEIGHGADRFDVQKFQADFAYTVDGGELGELEYENFNAARAVININGKSVHPGAAKNKMVNALQVAQSLAGKLPSSQRPENTEDYKGFFHLTSLVGNVSSAKMEYIIRDHDFQKFEDKKALLTNIVETLNQKHGYHAVQLEMNDQYYNMKQKIEPVMYVVELAKDAMKIAGITAIIRPIRGGTDGARLSYMGLPCPNLFTGGHNFHGPWEFIPVESMVKAVDVLINICTLTVNLKK